MEIGSEVHIDAFDDRMEVYSPGGMFDGSIVQELDTDNVAWPAQVVNYTSKTQFLFRIEKGVLDINDSGVNDSFVPDEIRVPFRNMVYIGDSDTDIPCMKLVNTYGGHSIGVYSAVTRDKAKVYKMMRDNRTRYFAMADYSEGSELDTLIKAIIDRTAKNEALEAKFFECKNKQIENDRQNTHEERRKKELLLQLEGSSSFANTHAVVEKMWSINDWNQNDRECLFEIALQNSQVRYILGDTDVKRFYSGLLQNSQVLSEKAAEVKAMIECKK